MGYAAYRNANFRNVRVVKDGVLYRSGQLSQAGLERLLHDHGIARVDKPRRLVGNRAIDQDQPCVDRVHGLGSAERQPTANHVSIQPQAPRHELVQGAWQRQGRASGTGGQ